MIRLPRRTLTSGAAATALAGAFGARAARGVTIAGYGGRFQTRFDDTILAAFRKAHPDVGVFYYAAGGALQTLTLLREQRALPYIDVALLEAGVAEAAVRDGLMEALTPATLPVLADLSPQAGAGGPVLMLDTLALGYSPSAQPKPPRVWRELWDTGFGSRIAMPAAPDTVALAMTAVAAALFGNRDPQQSLDAGLNALAGLRPRITAWDPVPDSAGAIAYGDATLGPGWNARGQAQTDETPGRFAAVLPADGSPVLPLTINLVQRSGAPEAARTLIAWLLGPQAQALIARTLYYAPVNPKADIPPAALARAGGAPATVARRIPIDWDSALRQRVAVVDAWRQHGLAAY